MIPQFMSSPSGTPIRFEARQTWLGITLMGWILLLAGLAGMGAPYYFYPGGERPLGPLMAGWWGGGWMFLFGWILQKSGRKARAPGGWVLRWDGLRLQVNLRSYLNDNYPPDPATTVSWSPSDIRWLRTVDQQGQRTRVDEGQVQNTSIRRRYLDIAVEGSLEAVERVLREETRRYAPGMLGSKVRHPHATVRVLPEGILRIAWRDETNALTPSLDEAKRRLQPPFPFQLEAREQESPLAKGEDLEGKLLDMVIRGEEMEAIKLARTLYDMDLTRAVQFVRELKQK